MRTYTAIALLSLLGITLSANAAPAIETPLPKLETATAQYMLSVQIQQRGPRPPKNPKKRSQRRDFTQPNVYTHPL